MLLCLLLLTGTAMAEPAVVTIDLNGTRTPISPLIYGINNFTDASVYNSVTATAVRQGGNRMSGYNWETNYSSAGSDWYHSSDTYLSSMTTPGYVATSFAKIANAKGVRYHLTTLQLAGYVAADKAGTVDEADTAPSSRWAEVIPSKGAALSLKPDLTDGKVYMDEYVHYLIAKLGDSTSALGIQAYSLDNEPALWMHTHARIHPEATGAWELIEKSIAVSKVVKALDPNAEIYGPALYGYTAYDHLADEKDPTWMSVKAARGYRWYLDYYLDEMRKASEAAGTRLLDVLDIHYYSESSRTGFEDRLQSVRTLYEKGFRENSWIGQWCQHNLPLLPTVMASIEKYYPGTKLAITEYNYGGEDISATIAQAETLGCFAAQGVYSAFIWGGNAWQYSGINLYTNFDRQGGAFGDTLIPAVTADHSKCVAYAAVDSDDNSRLTVMLTNKTAEAQQTTLILQGGVPAYQSVRVYAVHGDSADIRLLEDAGVLLNPGTLTVTLPAYCAAMVVLTTDAP
ncbi:MAG: glycoside hydrolase family 44 protein [Clostridia bacterium]|nr:glycoside hydrolase family 44 protein [Clostridia bacterium]